MQCPNRPPTIPHHHPFPLSRSLPNAASEPPKPRYLEPSSDNGGGRDERASAAMQLSREIFQHCIKICRILKVVNLPRSPSLPLSLCSSSYHLPSSGPHSPLSLPLSSLITLITTRNWKEDSFVKKGWVWHGTGRDGRRGGDGAPKAVSSRRPRRALARCPPLPIG